MMKVFTTGLFAASLAACGGAAQQRRAGIDPAPEVQAPRSMGSAFIVESARDRPDGAYRLGILKDALDKEYLLQASLIQQPLAPMWSGLKSRVVAFQKRDNQLVLLEASQGHVLHTDLPQYLVLATLPIIEETESHIFFDFNAGMSKVFVSFDWHVTDFEGPYYPANNFSAVETSASYLQEAQIIDDRRLEVTQVAQLNFGGDFPTFAVRYNFTPYQPDQDFKPTKSPGFDHVGFFEVAPQLVVGGAEDLVYASKWQAKRPVTFAISANTPAAFKEAVREGILYWNKAFGREVVKVLDAPSGVTAPSFDHNVVQWIDFDHAGFAYADAQMDPRTGEILHAQVFMSSAFAFYSLADARSLLRRLDLLDKKKEEKLTSVGLAGFSSAPLCQRRFPAQFARDLTRLVADRASDAQIQKIAQDQVREVVAHEIGHTLGLRHNFAGSQGASYELAARPGIVASYLKNGDTPADVLPTTSVMDYNAFVEASMTGDRLAREPGALPYDTLAIKVLYDNEPVPARTPLFCTDSHVFDYLDCLPFDVGHSVVEFAQWDRNETIEILPDLLANLFINMKAPPKGFTPRDFRSWNVTGDRLARGLSGSRILIPYALSETGKALRIWRRYEYVTELNKAEVDASYRDYLETEFVRLGGLEQVLAPLDASVARDWVTKFERLIDSPEYRNGVSASGEPYSLTDEDVAVAKELVRAMLANFSDDLAYRDSEVLGYVNKLAEHPLANKFAAVLKARVESIVLSSPSTTAQPVSIPTDDGGTAIVTGNLPNFQYSQRARVAAAALLRKGRGIAPEWGVTETKDLKDKFTKLLTSALTVAPDKVDAGLQSRDVARWLLDNGKVLTALGSEVPAESSVTRQ